MQPVTDPESFAALLQRFRMARGLSVRELASISHVNRKTIRSYEDEKTVPRGKAILEDIASALRLDDSQYHKLLDARTRFLYKRHFKEQGEVSSMPDQQYFEAAPPQDISELGTLFNVPELPKHFLPRAPDIESLKELLFKKNDVVGITSRSYRVGVQGMGGVGKTVLASALARDEEVRRMFPDGIVWLTFGREPDIVALQFQVSIAIANTPQAFVSEQQGVTHLAKMLTDKRCLLILDDVWKLAHAVPFTKGVGSNCRILITTRDEKIVRDTGAGKHRLEVLNDEQALILLAQWANCDVADLPPEAYEMIQECSNLPLALAMAGAIMRYHGVKWEAVLSRLRSADIEKIRYEFPDYPYHDLFRVIQVSVDFLDERARLLYLSLAVFHEDVRIPERALLLYAHGDGYDEIDTIVMVDRLVDMSLMQRGDERSVFLHDLQLDYISKQFVDTRILHNDLLAKYARVCTNGWASGPNDGYFFQFLAYHLKCAQRNQELSVLLLDFGWLEAKTNATDITLLIADYETVLTADQAEEIHSKSKCQSEYASELRLCQNVLRMSSHILVGDPLQLAAQLLSRLLSYKTPVIQSLLAQAQQWCKTSWLRPLNAGLTSPEGALIQTLTGHTDSVNTLLLLEKKGWLLSASADTTLKLWDLKSGKIIHTLTGHSQSIYRLAAAPNNLFAISLGEDKKWYIWNLRKGLFVRSVSFTGNIRIVVFSPVGILAVSTTKDGVINLFNYSKVEKYTFNSHKTKIKSVLATKDGKFLVSFSEDHIIKVWDLGNMIEVCTIEEIDGSILNVVVSENGRYILSINSKGVMKVWDLLHGSQLYTCERQGDDVIAIDEKMRLDNDKFAHIDMAVSSDGRFAILHLNDYVVVELWDLEIKQFVCHFTVRGGVLSCVNIDLEGKYVVCGSGSYVEIFSLNQLLARSNVLSLNNRGVTAMLIVNTQKSILLTSGDYNIDVRDLETLDLKHTIPGRASRDPALSGHNASVVAMAVTPDEKKVLVMYGDGVLKKVDTVSWIELAEAETDIKVETIAITVDGNFVLLGARDGIIHIWDINLMSKVSSTMQHSKRPVVDLSVIPDGKFALSSGADGVIKWWDLDKRIEIMAIKAHNNWSRSINVTKDGKFIVSGGHDGLIKVWDSESGKEIRVIPAYNKWIRCLKLSPNGIYVAALSFEEVKVFHIGNGEEVARFQGDSTMMTCAFLPDGKRIIVGGAHSRIHLLYLEECSGAATRGTLG